MAAQARGRLLRGVALIEALVALTVTALGVVAVLGIQSVLRQNADIAKQRSEAVRLAQAEIERWRSFDPTVAASIQGQYAALNSGSNLPVDGSNTAFTVTRQVTTSATPAYKTLVVHVDWTDRSGQAQRVTLNTLLNDIAAALAASVVVPADGGPVARAGGRHAGIPLGAKQISPTQSAFKPPPSAQGSDSIVWVFNNLTGLFTICTTTAATTQQVTLENIANCGTQRFQLLSGYVRFALPVDNTSTPQQPSPQDAEFPVDAHPDLADPLQVMLRKTAPSPAEDIACLSERSASLTPFMVYFCAVPPSTDTFEPARWSGRAMVTGSPALTDDPAQAGTDRLRVCRYTPYTDDRTVESGLIKNFEHPLDYFNVSGPLTNQNFLVIRAGNGSVPFTCPPDDPAASSPSNTNTKAHPLP
jgi:Tfp pilus assembly protein PilV